MTVRIVKPSRLAPEVPPDVAMTVKNAIRRHDLALEGKIPEAQEIITSLEDELDRMYDELDGRVTEEVETACYRANTAWMIWGSMRDYVFAEPNTIPTSADGRLQHALSGMTYAALIRTGVNLSQWSETWQQTRYGGIAWPSDMHAICAAVGCIASEGLGGPGLALDLAADMHDDAVAMLASIAPSSGESV